MPWIFDRMEGESASYFAMFTFYRDLGPIRTYEAVRREFDRSPSQFATIHKRWNWKERALAYDHHLDQVRQGATRLTVHNMAQRQAALGVKMQVMAEKRLGEFAENPDLMASVSIGDTVKLAAEGVRIERLAEGESTGEENQPIIFNITGSSLPKWAPKQVQESLVSPSPNAEVSGGANNGDGRVDLPAVHGEAASQ
jgi:hypothetical protein